MNLEKKEKKICYLFFFFGIRHMQKIVFVYMKEEEKELLTCLFLCILVWHRHYGQFLLLHTHTYTYTYTRIHTRTICSGDIFVYWGLTIYHSENNILLDYTNIPITFEQNDEHNHSILLKEINRSFFSSSSSS